MIKRAFTEHPASVGESYFQHMGMAFSFGAKMIVAGFACALHGLFPFLFVRTGSQCITNLHDCMVAHRDHRECVEAGEEMPALARDKTEMSAAQ
jgi:uncharacterized protein DUF6356